MLQSHAIKNDFSSPNNYFYLRIQAFSLGGSLNMREKYNLAFYNCVPKRLIKAQFFTDSYLDSYLYPTCILLSCKSVIF